MSALYSKVSKGVVCYLLDLLKVSIIYYQILCYNKDKKGDQPMHFLHLKILRITLGQES